MKIIKIGRGSSNDININDSLVSRAHCQIIQDDHGNFRLIDVNSSNGTYVNGIKRHGEIQLNKFDIIRIGNSTLPWQTYFPNNGGEKEVNSGSAENSGIANNINIEVGNNNGCVFTPSPPHPPSYKPDNFLTWAILSTIFCCLPFGIVSIVYASKVNGLWYAGNYDEAQDAASNARTWFWWSFATGILINLFYMIYYVVVIAAML